MGSAAGASVGFSAGAAVGFSTGLGVGVGLAQALNTMPTITRTLIRIQNLLFMVLLSSYHLFCPAGQENLPAGLR